MEWAAGIRHVATKLKCPPLCKVEVSHMVVMEHADALPADLKSTVRESKRLNIFARQPARDLILGQDDPLSLIGEGKLRTNKAFVLEGKHISQAVGFHVHRPMQVVRAARGLCKLSVIAVGEAGQEGVGSVYVRDACKPEVLDQAIL